LVATANAEQVSDPAERTPAVIYLNGVSSAGKSTLARALVAAMETPYCLVSMDTFEGMAHRRFPLPDASAPHRRKVGYHGGATRENQAAEFTSAVVRRGLGGLHAAFCLIAVSALYASSGNVPR